MRVGRAELLFSAMALFASSATAGETYQCEIEIAEKEAKLPTVISFEFLEGGRKGVVVEEPTGVPFPAIIEKRSEYSYRFDWTAAHGVDEDGSSQELHFTAFLNLKNLKMTVRSLDQKQNSRPLRGAGTCGLEVAGEVTGNTN